MRISGSSKMVYVAQSQETAAPKIIVIKEHVPNAKLCGLFMALNGIC